jgi:hypothetical protein
MGKMSSACPLPSASAAAPPHRRHALTPVKLWPEAKYGAKKWPSGAGAVSAKSLGEMTRPTVKGTRGLVTEVKTESIGSLFLQLARWL